MKRLALFLPLLVLACGDSPAEPEPLSTVLAAADLTIISGDLQTDTILARLTEPLEVKLTDDAGLPIADAPIRYVTTEDGCGDAFLGHTTTDALGEAADVWDLGTVAGECEMEVRALDENDTPRIVESFTATVRPGAPVDSPYWITASGDLRQDSLRIFPTEGAVPPGYAGTHAPLWDQHQNEVPWELSLVSGPVEIHDRGEYWVILPTGLGSGEMDVITDYGTWRRVFVWSCEDGRVGWHEPHPDDTDPFAC